MSNTMTTPPAPRTPPPLTARQRAAVLALVKALRCVTDARDALDELQDAITPLTDADWRRLELSPGWIADSCTGGLYVLGSVIEDLTCDTDAAILELAGIYPQLSQRSEQLMRELGLAGKPVRVAATAQ